MQQSGGIYLFNADSLQICFANIQAVDDLGYELEALLGMRITALYPQLSIATFTARLATLLRRQVTELTLETLQQRQDGRCYPVTLQLQLLTLAGVDYVHGAYQDVEARLRYQAQLKFTQFAMDNVYVEVYWLDKDARICYANRKACETLGYSPAQLLQLTVPAIDPLFAQSDWARHWEALKRDGSQFFETVHQRSDGSQFPVEVLANYIQFGEIEYNVAFARDISLQQQIKQHLIELNTELDRRVQSALLESREKDFLLQQQSRMVAMGEMIGNIAHQWRQPLNSLSIILMNLEDAVAHGEATSQSINRAVARSQELLANMSRTIDDFRGFFRHDKLLAATRLADVVVEAIHLLETALAYHQIKLTLHNQDCPVMALVHAGELSQALLCLINNAKDQILERQVAAGEISIHLEENASWAVIRVADNAGGIAEADQLRIFDPYFTSKADGMGLGLYITKLTVEQSMRGQVKACNLGAGACFSLFLPKVIHQDVDL